MPVARVVRKRLFFGADDAANQLAPEQQIGICVLHFLDDRLRQLVEKRLVDAQFLSVAHGSTHDFAQHVAAPPRLAGMTPSEIRNVVART